MLGIHVSAIKDLGRAFSMYPKTAVFALLVFSVKGNPLVSPKIVHPFATIVSRSERDNSFWHTTNRRYVKAYLSKKDKLPQSNPLNSTDNIKGGQSAFTATSQLRLSTAGRGLVLQW